MQAIYAEKDDWANSNTYARELSQPACQQLGIQTEMSIPFK